MAKDVDALLSFYDEDAVLIWTGETLKKKKEIREFWVARRSDPNYKIISGQRDVFIFSEAGDMAFMQGTSSYRSSSGKQSPAVVAVKGNWMTVWRKRKDGKWKIIADSFNLITETPVGKEN
jgi:ketosteroid isomerase-like protein